MTSRTKWGTVTVLWIGFILLSFILLERGSYGGGDFHLYYRAARDYLPTRMPYPTVVENLHDSLPYPPFLPQLLIPIARLLDIVWATRLWYALNLAAFIGMIAALSRFLKTERRFTLWVLAAFFVPVFEALRIGQVNTLLMVLFALAWVCIKNRRPALGGILLAIAIWVKLYPALILVYFVWKRDWRVVLGGVVGTFVIVLFQIAVSDVQLLVGYFESVLTLAGQGDPTLMWKNNSIWGFTTKLFQPGFRIVPLLPSPTLSAITRIGLIALVVGALFALTLNTRQQKSAPARDEHFDLEYGLAVLTMMLISPWVYPDTFSQVFITWFILWRRNDAMRYQLLLTLSGILIAANWLLIWEPTRTFSVLVLSLGFYALALLWVANVVLLAQTSRWRWRAR